MPLSSLLCSGHRSLFSITAACLTARRSQSLRQAYLQTALLQAQPGSVTAAARIAQLFGCWVSIHYWAAAAYPASFIGIAALAIQPNIPSITPRAAVTMPGSEGPCISYAFNQDRLQRVVTASQTCSNCKKQELQGADAFKVFSSSSGCTKSNAAQTEHHHLEDKRKRATAVRCRASTRGTSPDKLRQFLRAWVNRHAARLGDSSSTQAEIYLMPGHRVAPVLWPQQACRRRVQRAVVRMFPGMIKLVAPRPHHRRGTSAYSDAPVRS